jgi:O-antigen/teichoic acid export membrane protein
MSAAPIEPCPLAGAEVAGSRGRDRLRRVRSTVVAAAAGRGCAVAGSLVSIALILRQLGPESYGIWAALLAFTGLFGVADLGLGYGLLNAVAEALGRDDPVRARQLVSSGVGVLTGVAAAVAAILSLALATVPWTELFRTADAGAAAKLGPAAAVLAGGLLLGLPFSVWQRVAAAAQTGYWVPAWDAIGAAVSLGGVWLAVRGGGDFTALAAALVAGPAVASVGGSLWYFGFRRQDLRPRCADFELALARRLLASGGSFIVLQGCGLLLPAALTLLLLRQAGPAEVTHYTLVGKLYQLAPQLAAFWFAPLWPAYRDALERGEAAWAHRTFGKVTLLVAGATAAGGAILVPTTEIIISWWTGTAVGPLPALNFGFAVGTLLLVATTSASTFLNASGYVGGQAWLAGGQVALSLAFSVVLVGPGGAAGAAWAVVGALLLLVVPVQVAVLQTLLREQRAAAA